MKTRALLMGLVLTPWLAFAAQAEEPPDDTIVQETLADLELQGFQKLPDPDAPYEPGTSPSAMTASALLEAQAWIKSERLS